MLPLAGRLHRPSFALLAAAIVLSVAVVLCALLFAEGSLGHRIGLKPALPPRDHELTDPRQTSTEALAPGSEGELTISGFVTRADGTGYPGVSVYGCPTVFGPCAYAQTGTDGGYSLKVARGSYRVQYGRTPDGSKPDGYYGLGGFTPDPGRAAVLTVNGASLGGINVVLAATPPFASSTPSPAVGQVNSPAPSISGRVVRPNGAGFPGISVYACPIPAGPCLFGITNSGGNYFLEGRAGSFEVQFGRTSDGSRPDGYYSSRGFTADPASASIIVLSGGPVALIDITLDEAKLSSAKPSTPVTPSAAPTLGSSGAAPPATATAVQSLTISGVVTRGMNFPYAGISVYACPVVPGPCGYAQTDGDGRYAIPVSNGSYRVQFGRTSDGSRPDGFYSDAGLIPAGSEASVLTVNGASLAGINVTFGDLPTLTPSLVPTATPTLNASPTLTPTSTPTATTSPKPTVAATISGRVTRVGGAAYAGISVYACPVIPGPCEYAQTAADGTYSIQVSDGGYRVQFGRTPDGSRPDGYYSSTGFTPDQSLATVLNVAGSSISGKSIVLPEPVFTVSGFVLRSNGAGHAGISVYACPTSPGMCGYAQTANDGGYSVQKLPEGSYRIQFGRTTDGSKPDGYYSTSGFTSDQAQATVITLNGASRSGISVVLPFE